MVTSPLLVSWCCPVVGISVVEAGTWRQRHLALRGLDTGHWASGPVDRRQPPPATLLAGGQPVPLSLETLQKAPGVIQVFPESGSQRQLSSRERGPVAAFSRTVGERLGRMLRWRWRPVAASWARSVTRGGKLGLITAIEVTGGAAPFEPRVTEAGSGRSQALRGSYWPAASLLIGHFGHHRMWMFPGSRRLMVWSVESSTSSTEHTLLQPQRNHPTTPPPPPPPPPPEQ